MVPGAAPALAKAGVGGYLYRPIKGYAPCRRPQGVFPGAASGWFIHSENMAYRSLRSEKYSASGASGVRCRDAVAMQRLQAVACRDKFSGEASPKTMQFVPRVLDVRSKEALRQMRCGEAGGRVRGGCMEDASRCRTRATKLRDHWTCSQRAERKLRAEFSAWQDKCAHGRQQCNTCVALACVCRVAQRANQRLLPLRQRLQREREQAIVDEVRREITQRTAQRATASLQSTPCGTGPDKAHQDAADAARWDARAGESPAHASTVLHPCAGQEKNKDSTFHYKCPFCEAAISSRIMQNIFGAGRSSQTLRTPISRERWARR